MHLWFKSLFTYFLVAGYVSPLKSMNNFVVQTGLAEEVGHNGQIPCLTNLAAKALIIHLSAIFLGDKKKIEEFISDQFLKKSNHQFLAQELAKEYFYLYGDLSKEDRSKKKEFLDIGIEYSFSFNEIFSRKTFQLISSDILDLSSLKLNSIDGLSAYNEADKVKTIWLCNNFISSIKKDDFASFPNLKTLALSNNRLTEVDPHIFEGLDLEDLSLGRNEISYFDLEELAKVCQKIEWLCLDQNKITEIKIPFNALVKLRALILSGNELTTLEPTHFAKLKRLRTLALPANISEEFICELIKDKVPESINYSMINGSRSKVLEFRNPDLERWWASR